MTALRPEKREGREFTPVDVRMYAETSADGQYRLVLPYAGEFLVVALPHNYARQTRDGHGNTFHPNAQTAGAASRVRVMTGQPAVADITLRPAPLASVSGVVLGSDGRPVPRARMFIAHGDGFFGLDSKGFEAFPDGRFGVSGLQPGTYFFGYRETEWPPARGTVPKVSQATVVISGKDVSNVRVVPLEMVHATGRVVVSLDDRKVLDPRTVRISGYPVPSDGNPGPQRGGEVRDDMTFEFRTWPMPGRVRVMIESSMWAVKAVRLNGVDITDKMIDFVQGKEITGLEVELVRR